MIKYDNFIDNDAKKKLLQKILDDYHKLKDDRGLKSIAKFSLFNNLLDNKKIYTQIGFRTLIPEFVFYDNSDNSILANDFARSIVNAELEFIFSKLVSSINVKKIKKINIDDNIKSIFSSDFDTAIITLNEKVMKLIYSLGLKEGKIKFNPEKLFWGNSKGIRLYFVNSEEFNGIVLFNSQSIKIIQKRAKDCYIPSSFSKGGEYTANDDESLLSLIYGVTFDNPDKLDLTVRSLINLEVIDESGLKIFKFNEKKPILKKKK